MTFADPTLDPRPSGDLIKEGTDASFMKGVIEASKTQPVIVDFWATWCASCDEEMRDLQRVADAHGLKVYGVNLDGDKGRAQKVARFAEEHGITYDLVGLHPDEVEEVFRKGKIRIPLSVLVGADGVVVDIVEGWDRTHRNRVIALTRSP